MIWRGFKFGFFVLPKLDLEIFVIAISWNWQPRIKQIFGIYDFACHTYIHMRNGLNTYYGRCTARFV